MRPKAKRRVVGLQLHDRNVDRVGSAAVWHRRKPGPPRRHLRLGRLGLAPAPATGDVRTYDFGNYQPILLPDGDDVIYAGGGDDLVYGDNRVSDPWW